MDPLWKEPSHTVLMKLRTSVTWRGTHNERLFIKFRVSRAYLILKWCVYYQFVHILSIEHSHWTGRSINKTQLSFITNFTELQYITRKEKTVVSQILYFYGFLWSSNGPLSFLNAFNGFRIIYIYISLVDIVMQHQSFGSAPFSLIFCFLLSYFWLSDLLLSILHNSLRDF